MPNDYQNPQPDYQNVYQNPQNYYPDSQSGYQNNFYQGGQDYYQSEPQAPQTDSLDSMFAGINQNFGTPTQTGASATNERLRDMNKKLPEWSLEPPTEFLK